MLFLIGDRRERAKRLFIGNVYAFEIEWLIPMTQSTADSLIFQNLFYTFTFQSNTILGIF